MAKIGFLEELEVRLEERSLSITIHPAGIGWVVWLFPADDPAQIIVKEGQGLAKLVEEAFDDWDGAGASSGGSGDGKAQPTHPPDEAFFATKLPGGGRGWRRPGAKLDPGEVALVPERQEDGTIWWKDPSST